MGTLSLLAVLWVGPSENFSGYQDFLKKNHTTIEALCKRHHAQGCVLKKERAEAVDELGLSIESGTMQWSLYGRREK
jgi:hypothetical protein